MRRIPVLWLLLPMIVVLLIFFGAFARFVADSVLHQIPGTAMTTGPASLVNYAAVLSSPLAQRTLLDTLVMSCEVTGIAALLGYPLAYLMARSPSARTRNAVLFVLTVTFLSGGITRAYAWMLILGNNGPINRTLRSLGWGSLQLINHQPGVVISLVHFVMPYFVLTLFGAINTIPVALEEAARNHGGTRWQAFTTVTLPLSVPGLLGAVLLTFTITLSSFLFPLLLGGGRVEMIATLIYDKMQTSFDMPSAAAMSLLFLVFALVPLSALSLLRAGLGRRYGGSRR